MKSVSSAISELKVSDPRLLILLWLLIGVLFIPTHPALQAVLGILYIFTMSYLLGKRYLTHTSEGFSLFMGFLLFVAYIVLLGSVFFYLLDLAIPGLIILTVASPALLLFGKNTISNLFHVTTVMKGTPFMYVMAILVYFVSLGGIFFILFKARSVESFVSPWPLLQQSPFFLYAIAIAALLSVIYKFRRLNWLYYIPLYFIALSVIVTVFPLGFGFDPFIHEASERLLIDSGTISPKPFFYVGYYVLTAWTHSVLGIPLSLVNSNLTLILASLLIPVSLYSVFRYVIHEKKYALIVPLLFLIFPYTELIESTPQSMSFLWSLLVILLSIIWISVRNVPWWILLLTALTTFLFHPLTGSLIVVYVLFIGIYRSRSLNASVRTALLISSFTAGVITVPAMLLVAGRLSPEFATSISFTPLSSALLPFIGQIYRYVRLEDLVYSFQNAVPVIVFAAAFVGFYEFRRRRLTDTAATVLYGALMIFLAYFIVNQFLVFDFATEGEQTIFSLRLVRLGLYFLLPLAILGIVRLVRESFAKPAILKSALAVLIIIFASFSWYLSYPRFDTRSQSKAFSASEHDFEAVHWIETDAQDSTYIVLANQTVSAVAVKEFGFQHYYKDIFYYPLPTNGILYASYLHMTTNTDISDTLAKVRSLTGVERVYFALNDYWNIEDTIVAQHRSSALRTHIIGEKAVTIFVY